MTRTPTDEHRSVSLKILAALQSKWPGMLMTSKLADFFGGGPLSQFYQEIGAPLKKKYGIILHPDDLDGHLNQASTVHDLVMCIERRHGEEIPSNFA